MEKPIQQKQKAGIVTSLNDMTLTKVTYGKYATRVPDEVAYGIYEWFSSQLNTLLHIIKVYMCDLKGYDFLVVLVVNRVSI